jgi:hypothetical protein
VNISLGKADFHTRPPRLSSPQADDGGRGIYADLYLNLDTAFLICVYLCLPARHASKARPPAKQARRTGEADGRGRRVCVLFNYYFFVSEFSRFRDKLFSR